MFSIPRWPYSFPHLRFYSLSISLSLFALLFLAALHLSSSDFIFIISLFCVSPRPSTFPLVFCLTFSLQFFLRSTFLKYTVMYVYRLSVTFLLRRSSLTLHFPPILHLSRNLCPPAPPHLPASQLPLLVSLSLSYTLNAPVYIFFTL